MLLPLTGWRGIFLAQVPIAMLALVLAFRSLPRSGAKRCGSSANVWVMLNKSMLPNLIVNFLVAAVMSRVTSSHPIEVRSTIAVCGSLGFAVVR